MRSLSILVVDDEKVQRETLASILQDQAYQVATAHDVPSAIEALRTQTPDVVLTDFRIPGGSGIDVARKASEICPESATLIMTAYADVNSVIEAMRAGVLDYLLKPLNVEALLRRLAIIRERRDLQAEVNFLRAEINRTSSGMSLLGESQALREVRRLIEQVSQTKGTVLITGESGTGKEVVAREIHRLSPQAANKFVAINCGALPEELLESELFGHKKGAFTGAIANKVGLFSVANEGTLFLDEIGEMPKNLQVKLLRAIQEREVTPVGDTKPIKVNLRIIAATNRDLQADVANGAFRQDLYFRINVVEIHTPPLRDRPEDIPMLARHFIEKHSREMGKPMLMLTNEASRRLMTYRWPGNVRELENIIERALILSKNHDKIDVEDLPAFLHGAPAAGEESLKLDDAVRTFSRAHILNVLEGLNGDKKEAAKALGMSLSSLYRKLEELGIPSKRPDEAKEGQVKLLPRTIGWRIFFTFTVLLVSLSSFFSVLGLQFAQKTIMANASNELRILSVVLSRQVQVQLARIEQSLTAMESHGFLVQELKKYQPDEAAIEEFLQQRLKALPLFQDLAVFNRNGLCIGATDPKWYDMAAKKQPFFVNGMKAFNFSDIFTSEDGKIQLVSTPVTNGNVVRGVLVAQVNLSSIYDLMDQKLGVSETTDAFLLDAALRFITPGKTGTDRLLESHLLATSLIKHLKEEFWVDKYKNYNGEEVLGTVLKIPGRKWYVVVERDLAEVNRPINDVKKAIFGGAIGVTLFLIIATYYLARSITRPLMVLVEGTQRLAKGDFKQPVKVPRGLEEVQFLATEVEGMRAKIAAYQERLLERLEESEKKRIESERLAAIGTLASTLAHEIRNPLNAMSLLLSRLELSRGGSAQADPVVRDLRGEIGRLDRLVSDILDYARPVSLQIREVDLRQLVESTVEIYRGYLDAKRIDCVTRFPETAVVLRGDQDRLKQCLVNLLQNAVDACEPGGRIEIEARAEDGRIDLAIRDDGVGLPAEAESRLFDLFFTTKDRGTGLGLSTVKKIVDAHGGQISLSRRAQAAMAAGDKTPRHSGTEAKLSFPATL